MLMRDLLAVANLLVKSRLKTFLFNQALLNTDPTSMIMMMITLPYYYYYYYYYYCY